MPERLQASAMVTVKLEIVVPDSWGPECQVSQVEKQAIESALQIIARAMPKEFNRYNTGSIRLADKPEVTAVLVRR